MTDDTARDGASTTIDEYKLCDRCGTHASDHAPVGGSCPHCAPGSVQRYERVTGTGEDGDDDSGRQPLDAEFPLVLAAGRGNASLTTPYMGETWVNQDPDGEGSVDVRVEDVDVQVPLLVRIEDGTADVVAMACLNPEAAMDLCDGLRVVARSASFHRDAGNR